MTIEQLCNDQVEHWNLTRYLNMVLESDWHDDTDVARQASPPLHLASLKSLLPPTFEQCFDINLSKNVTSKAPNFKTVTLITSTGGPKDLNKL
jgi:hypothetical protein